MRREVRIWKKRREGTVMLKVKGSKEKTIDRRKGGEEGWEEVGEDGGEEGWEKVGEEGGEEGGKEGRKGKRRE